MKKSKQTFIIDTESILLNSSLDIELNTTIDMPLEYDVLKAYIQLNGTINRLPNEKYAIKAEANLSLTMPCSLCLTGVSLPIQFSIIEHFVTKPQDTTQNKETDLDAIYFDNHMVDILPIILSFVFINIPMKVVCGDNCKGLCVKCGINLNGFSCDCKGDELNEVFTSVLELFPKENN